MRATLRSSRQEVPEVIHPLRVAIKALLLFVVFNLVYAALGARPGWFLVLGRGTYERFPALWVPEIHDDGSVLLKRKSLSNIDILFASHILTRPKAADEYRVFLFGDSSVWGMSLEPSQTLAGQVNALGLHTCTGRRVVAYNLGYPLNSATKDLLFMQRSQQYQPDLNIWLFSLLAFQRVRQNAPFVVDNPLAVRELVEKYALPHDIGTLSPMPDPFWGATIVGQRHDLNLLIRVQASNVLLAMLGMDDPRVVEGARHVPDIPKATQDCLGISPPADLRDYLAFETLPIAFAITGGKIVYVGEPIEISTGEHSSIAYNSLFPRWAYNQFREITADMAVRNGWMYLDLWNLIPAEQFSDTIFHLLPEGETMLAKRLADAILAAACP